MAFSKKNKHYIQSEFLSLNASGSTGSDCPKGIHLRWFFTGLLGDSHVPLGNKGEAANLINRGDDFVNIYKLPYRQIKEAAQLTLDFEQRPYFIHPYFPVWNYNIGGIFFQLTFLDANIYESATRKFNEASFPKEFYTQYCVEQGKIAIELLNNEFCFAIDFESIKDYENLKLETFSSFIKNEEKEEVISNRINGQTLSDRQKSEGILGDNMSKLIYQLQESVNKKAPLKINFYSYSKAVSAFNGTPSQIGKFSITQYPKSAWQEVRSDLKLEEWKRWKHNKELSINNYQKKFDEIISEHLQPHFSPNSNLLENFYLKLQDDDPTTINSTAQFFNALAIASLDYHIARMLGFGFSDWTNTENTYIYLMEYSIEKDGDAKNLLNTIPDGQHLYLSLPTSTQYDNSPVPLHLKPVRYGLKNMDVSTVNEKGYEKDRLIRHLRLHGERDDFRRSESFFTPNTLFSAAHLNPSIFAGVLHRKEGAGANDWIKPELQDFKSMWIDENDNQEILDEVHPIIIPANAQDSMYIHELDFKEDNNVSYEYALYPIDIFSRSGNRSNIVVSDKTKFSIPNLLLPPHNVSVQLIQEENPLISSSVKEQERLETLEDDKTLVRVTFDYNHIHDINSTKLGIDDANHFGSEVQFFFRETLPQISPKLAEDETANLVKFGFGSQKSIVKLITHPLNGSLSNFVGGYFSTHGYRFKILQVISRSKIRVDYIEERTQTSDNGIFTYHITKRYPKDVCEGSDSRYYTIHENLEKASSWGRGNPLKFSAQIDFENLTAWEKRSVEWEEQQDNGKVDVKRTVRGFWGTIEVIEKDDNGIAILKFKDVDFPIHPQEQDTGNSVEFEKGILRIESDEEIRAWMTLKVLKIENIGGKLGLKVSVDSSELESIDNGIPFKAVYHPSYKCYLVAEKKEQDNTSVPVFNEQHIFPDTGRIKKTIMALNTICKNPNRHADLPSFSSPLSTSRFLSAEKHISAFKLENIDLPPEKPIFATPPDSYSKSTFSFKLPIIKEPYQIVVYRADITSILSALYNTKTVRNIKGELNAHDPCFTQRLCDLANLEREEIRGGWQFKKYENSKRPDYRFPSPDKDDLGKLEDVINEAFIPITEKPLLFSTIKNNQKISRETPAKLVGEQLIVTDFNLDGEKSTSYFYMARTIGTGYQISPQNKIIGPVQQINNRPPKAPIVKNVIVKYDAEYIPKITFNLIKHANHINIKNVELRQTDSALKAKVWRLMKVVQTTDPNLDLSAIDFSLQGVDYEDITFGQKLYFRLNAQKEIFYTPYDKDILEPDLIPSQASKIVSVTLIDNKTPKPPELNINDDNELICEKRCYQGTYILEQLNHKGVWKLANKKIKSPDPLIKFNQLLEENLSPNIFLKYRLKVINTNGLDSGWSSIFVFTISDDNVITRVN